MGASDMFVFQVSKYLASFGHEVILNTNTDYNGIDKETGVLWSSEIKPGTDECDVLLIQRLPFKYDKVKYKKVILMCHDNIDAPVMKNLDKFTCVPDAFMVLSTFHKEQLLKWNIPTEKIFIVPEGYGGTRIETSMPSYEYNRDKTIVYSSAPFKGFPLLMKLWKKIKTDTPGIKLHLCTGMDLYNSSENDHYFKELYDLAKSDPDIVFHGVKTNKEVLEVVGNCSLMAYPNIFVETFCLSAMEAIAQGVPVITSDLGALPETVGDCGIIIKNHPKTIEYQDEFCRQIKMFFADENLRQALRINCTKRKILTWKDVAEKIEEKIKEIML
jgi:glycosyltransferase involved in cell wall biosynthesis